MNSYQVDRAKWQRLTIFEQMGNIYSEIGRTFAARGRGDTEAAAAAAERAFDLFDATCEQLAVHKSPKLHEVLRAREVFAGQFINHQESDLDNYFMQFALASRIRQFA